MRMITSNRTGWLYLGTAAVGLLLGLYFMFTGAFTSAVILFLLGAGSGLLAAAHGERLRGEPGRARLLRLAGALAMAAAVAVELMRIFRVDL